MRVDTPTQAATPSLAMGGETNVEMTVVAKAAPKTAAAVSEEHA
jgi:hypothetical protein